MIPFKLSTSAQSSLTEIIETAYRSVAPELCPIYLGELLIGHTQASLMQNIDQYLQQEEQELNFLQVSHNRLVLTPTTPHDLSIELRILAQYLREQHLITGWRDEEFSYLDDIGHERFRVERSMFKLFGLLSRAVHVNGYMNGDILCLARRSATKQIDPLLLDNLTAGGVSANETVLDCAIRELFEEAGVSATDAFGLHPIGLISVRRNIPHFGVHHEALYTFDLKLHDAFIPKNQDDEVCEFLFVTYEEALHLIMSNKMTIDAAVVTADFLLRHCANL